MDKYHNLILMVKKDLENFEKKYNKVSNTRLLISIVGILLFISSIINKSTACLGLFLCSCVIFIVLLVSHERLREEKDYLEAKLAVLNKNEERNNLNWSSFADTGLEFLNEDSTIEKDLDIFGKNSLYQYINVCNTVEGRKILSVYLKETSYNSKILCSRQAAVKEFIDKKELAMELETLSMMIGVKNGSNHRKWYESLIIYLSMKKPLLGTSIILLSILLPAITLLTFVLSMIGYIDSIIPSILAVFQILLSYYVSYRNKEIVSKVFRFCSNIRGYYRMICFLENTVFESEYLIGLKRKISNELKASKGIEKLDHLNDAFLIQRNPYIHILLQMVFMYDIHCIRQLEKWKKHYADNMMTLFQVIGDMEAILSLSVLGRERRVTFPAFKEDKTVYFDANDMSHPLISQYSVETNSICIKNGVEIITGSNMSGKTTFLRTIGLNMILAYAGAPVCAKSMNLSFMRLFTSMRIQDDISKGVSSFYAEVLRIKDMVEYSKLKKPMIVLIDEIFKGTNSADRIAGAKEIIKSFNKKYIIAVVSTHDFELCSLVETREVKGNNHHFKEYYEKDRIYFDYKIQEGRCKTTNAKYILRMAGLLEDT